MSEGIYSLNPRPIEGITVKQEGLVTQHNKCRVNFVIENNKVITKLNGIKIRNEITQQCQNYIQLQVSLQNCKIYIDKGVLRLKPLARGGGIAQSSEQPINHYFCRRQKVDQHQDAYQRFLNAVEAKQVIVQAYQDVMKLSKVLAQGPLEKSLRILEILKDQTFEFDLLELAQIFEVGLMYFKQAIDFAYDSGRVIRNQLVQKIKDCIEAINQEIFDCNTLGGPEFKTMIQYSKLICKSIQVPCSKNYENLSFYIRNLLLDSNYPLRYIENLKAKFYYYYSVRRIDSYLKSTENTMKLLKETSLAKQLFLCSLQRTQNCQDYSEIIQQLCLDQDQTVRALSLKLLLQQPKGIKGFYHFHKILSNLQKVQRGKRCAIIDQMMKYPIEFRSIINDKEIADQNLLNLKYFAFQTLIPELEFQIDLYVDPDCITSKTDFRQRSLNKTLEGFFQGAERLMLVSGFQGSGKTLMLKMSMIELLTQEQLWIPFYISLPKCVGLTFAQYIEYSYNVSRQWLEEQKVILLLDGLDEIDIFEWQLECGKMLKVIITCDSQKLAEQEFLQGFISSSKAFSKRLFLVHIQPFNYDKIVEYTSKMQKQFQERYQIQITNIVNAIGNFNDNQSILYNPSFLFYAIISEIKYKDNQVPSIYNAVLQQVIEKTQINEGENLRSTFKKYLKLHFGYKNLNQEINNQTLLLLLQKTQSIQPYLHISLLFYLQAESIYKSIQNRSLQDHDYNNRLSLHPSTLNLLSCLLYQQYPEHQDYLLSIDSPISLYLNQKSVQALQPPLQFDSILLQQEEDLNNNLIDDITHMHTLQGHSNYIRGIAISCNDQYVGTASYDNTAKIWLTQTGELVKTLQGHTDKVIDIAFSPNNQHVITSSADNTLIIWAIETGEKIGTLTGHTNQVWSVTVSSDAKWIVSGSLDYQGRVWDSETFELKSHLIGHGHYVLSVAITLTNDYIVTGSYDHNIKIWTLPDGENTNTLTGHTGEVYGVAISSNNEYIVSGSVDQTIKIWRFAGDLIQTLTGHTSYVWAVAISTDDQYIVSGSMDNTMKIWNLKTGELIKTIQKHTSDITCLAISSENQYVVTGSLDHTAIVWRSDKLISVDEEEKLIEYFMYLQNASGRFRDNFSLV